uniref:Replication-associated protein n=1 Tax=Motacilla cinerea CRESS-DNA-virus sp. TaxID=2815043 RepID=A0A8A4XBE5_9VIRU|nr:MAG: replication-associated protein [Motacilla cinerea CRESS-DNA-virus sp.]
MTLGYHVLLNFNVGVYREHRLHPYNMIRSLRSLTIQFAIMRSFAPYDKTKQRSKAGDKKKYKERTSDEWDLRIDCTPQYADELVQNIKDARAIIKYALVSGIEQADKDVTAGGSANNHVHIGVIFEYELRRDQVLTTIRGLFKKTDEYCTPRNKKFTYAGWYMHHSKIDWKMVLEPAVRLELGVLPEDEHNEYNTKAIKRLFEKFGNADVVQRDINKERFAKYLND